MPQSNHIFTVESPFVHYRLSTKRFIIDFNCNSKIPFRLPLKKYNIRIQLFHNTGIKNILQNKFKSVTYILHSFKGKAIEEIRSFENKIKEMSFFFAQ